MNQCLDHELRILIENEVILLSKIIYKNRAQLRRSFALQRCKQV